MVPGVEFLSVCMTRKNSTTLQNFWLIVLIVTDLECSAVIGTSVTHTRFSDHSRKGTERSYRASGQEGWRATVSSVMTGHWQA